MRYEDIQVGDLLVDEFTPEAAKIHGCGREAFLFLSITRCLTSESHRDFKVLRVGDDGSSNLDSMVLADRDLLNLSEYEIQRTRIYRRGELIWSDE